MIDFKELDNAIVRVCAQSLLFSTPWTKTCQVSLSVEFSNQEY